MEYPVSAEQAGIVFIGGRFTYVDPWTVPSTQSLVGAAIQAPAASEVYAEVTGSVSAATFNTSTNDTLKIKTDIHAVYSEIAVTADAALAIATLIADLNTEFVSAGLDLVADNVATNKVRIRSTEPGLPIYVDTVAGGSILSTAIGLDADGETEERPGNSFELVFEDATITEILAVYVTRQDDSGTRRREVAWDGAALSGGAVTLVATDAEPVVIEGTFVTNDTDSPVVVTGSGFVVSYSDVGVLELDISDGPAAGATAQLSAFASIVDDDGTGTAVAVPGVFDSEGGTQAILTASALGTLDDLDGPVVAFRCAYEDVRSEPEFNVLAIVRRSGAQGGR